MTFRVTSSWKSPQQSASKRKPTRNRFGANSQGLKDFVSHGAVWGLYFERGIEVSAPSLYYCLALWLPDAFQLTELP